VNKKIAPLIEYLPPEVFEQQAFDSQNNPLFEIKSADIKEKLNTVLKSLYSEENLNFLEDLHHLNSITVFSAVDLQQALRVIEQKYIVKDAKTQINIQQSTLEKILAKPYKSLLDYRQAITEVFDLIRTNVSKYSEELQTIDKMISIKTACNLFIENLNSFPKPAKKLPFPFNKLNSSPQDKIIESCNNYCKTAQHELFTLRNDKTLSPDELKIKFDSITVNVISKLSESFLQLSKLQSNSSGLSEKAMAVRMIMNSLNDVKVSVFREESSSNRRLTDSRMSDDSASRSNSPSPSQFEDKKRDSLSLKDVMKEPTHYKPSSRVSPQSVNRPLDITPKGPKR
jgi:hypothetical protein